jgi:hypothetical protein
VNKFTHHEITFLICSSGNTEATLMFINKYNTAIPAMEMNMLREYFLRVDDLAA